MPSWKPKTGHIMTPWADTVDPDGPLPGYPRPQMVRSEWLNLNGLWNYEICEKGVKRASSFDNQILVPYAIESALSGVKQPLQADERLWYRRRFNLPDHWEDKRILLNFEAVDWQCHCYLNGQLIGEHTGGYLPFSFDITPYLNGSDGENELVVAVWDPTDTHWQQKGKQVLDPGTIYYTATSGIWQTVWLEAVDTRSHIEDIKLYSDIDQHTVSVEVLTSSPATVDVKLMDTDSLVADCSSQASEGCTRITLTVPSPRLWCPEDPFLYGIYIELKDGDMLLDSIESYIGMRKISVGDGSSGHRRIYLNNQPLFLHGPLDQGYWPESGMTPPSEDAMIFDIEKTLALGFNMTRKHIKVEPRRWYYHADRLGLPVIQDMINGGKRMGNELETLMAMFLKIRKSDTRPRSYKKAGRELKESRQQFESELRELVDHLFNHPSIVIWVPFNESWGQFDSERITDELKQHDPSRLVDHVSGWFDQGAGDFLSKHTYSIALKKPPPKDKRIYFISEYGGYSYQVASHLWDNSKKFGYKTYIDNKVFEKAYCRLIRKQLIPLIEKGLGAAVYTQFSDVEIESNGFYTYDRKKLKIPVETVRKLNQEIYKTFSQVENNE